MHANKNIRRLKLVQIALQFSNLGSIEECMVVCYRDVSFANVKNASSQGGYIMFLYKDEEKFAPISWKSKKIQRVVKEYFSCRNISTSRSLRDMFHG